MKSDIKVSVCVVTYNQEKYIAECLQSLVDQQCDFKFEVIVGEDCSTDSTRKIIDEFGENYPDIIVKNYQEKNVGAVANVVSSYRLARGKYICHMDGDDGALQGKLQKQADILDAHPECVICSHDVNIISDEDVTTRRFKDYPEGVHTLNDLYLTLPFFAHSSKMFVNDLSEPYWDSLHPEVLDIELHVLQAKSGNIYHVNYPLGFYRENVGVSVTNPENFIFSKAVARMLSDINIIEDKLGIRKVLYWKLFGYAFESVKAADRKTYFKHIRFIKDQLEEKDSIKIRYLTMYPHFTLLIFQSYKCLKGVVNKL